jgi:hypothetical protein
MSLTYSSYVTAIQTLMPTTSADVDFASIFPSAIDYAEQRLYRELDLLSTVNRDTSGTVTANSRTFTLPQSIGLFVVVDGINIITPVGSTASNGTRNPLVPASRSYIDFVWPSETAASAATVPSLWAPVTDQIILLGPAPGAGFAVEVIGTIRPTPISASNTTTFLSLNLPDLFVAATMIFISGYMKNYGAQSDDPKLAVSWDSQYDKLFASANAEEMRRKFGHFAPAVAKR